MPKLTNQQIKILMFGTGLLMGAIPVLMWGGVGILLAMIVIELIT